MSSGHRGKPSKLRNRYGFSPMKFAQFSRKTSTYGSSTAHRQPQKAPIGRLSSALARSSVEIAFFCQELQLFVSSPQQPLPSSQLTDTAPVAFSPSLVTATSLSVTASRNSYSHIPLQLHHHPLLFSSPFHSPLQLHHCLLQLLS
jgi:hypothetical protein